MAYPPKHPKNGPRHSHGIIEGAPQNMWTGDTHTDSCGCVYRCTVIGQVDRDISNCTYISAKSA